MIQEQNQLRNNFTYSTKKAVTEKNVEFRIKKKDQPLNIFCKLQIWKKKKLGQVILFQLLLNISHNFQPFVFPMWVQISKWTIVLNGKKIIIFYLKNIEAKHFEEQAGFCLAYGSALEYFYLL